MNELNIRQAIGLVILSRDELPRFPPGSLKYSMKQIENILNKKNL